jgi:hypothetical protein
MGGDSSPATHVSEQLGVPAWGGRNGSLTTEQLAAIEALFAEQADKHGHA